MKRFDIKWCTAAILLAGAMTASMALAGCDQPDPTLTTSENETTAGQMDITPETGFEETTEPETDEKE